MNRSCIHSRLCSLPVTLVGIIVGLFITGMPLSITAFIGVIMLASIVVNNAIILVSYINIYEIKESNVTKRSSKLE
ncbi:efflux RND transporter permease subunit [Anaerobacillus sp. HL2]|nr:efflux RND transporter permease subunit [Anaerobacillus sp. HL2]